MESMHAFLFSLASKLPDMEEDAASDKEKYLFFLLQINLFFFLRKMLAEVKSIASSLLHAVVESMPNKSDS